MSDTTISFEIQGDSEGYVTFKCPYCDSEFKLQAGEYQNDEEPFEDLFCPYCGLTHEKNNFLSQEVVNHIQALVQNYLVEMLNDAFGKMSKSINRSKSLIKMDFKPLKKVEVGELKDKDTTETEFMCEHCGHHVKVLYCAGASKIFCPYCGVDL